MTPEMKFECQQYWFFKYTYHRLTDAAAQVLIDGGPVFESFKLLEQARLFMKASNTHPPGNPFNAYNREERGNHRIWDDTFKEIKKECLEKAYELPL